MSIVITLLMSMMYSFYLLLYTGLFLIDTDIKKKKEKKKLNNVSCQKSQFQLHLCLNRIKVTALSLLLSQNFLTQLIFTAQCYLSNGEWCVVSCTNVSYDCIII